MIAKRKGVFLVVLALLCMPLLYFAQSPSPQQPAKPAPTVDDFGQVHKDVLTPKSDGAAEAGRFTDEVVKSLPAGSMPRTHSGVPGALEELFLGIGLTILLVSIALKLHWIANLARDYGWLLVVILTLVFGCYFLYSIRYLWPLAYGFAEIQIGAWLLYAAMLGAPQGAADELTYWTLVGKFAAAVCTFDGLNHILSPEGLEAALRNTAAALQPGAPFVFDVLLEGGYQTGWAEGFTIVREDHVLLISGSGYDFRRRLVNRAWEELWGVTLDQLADYNILHDPQLEAKVRDARARIAAPVIPGCFVARVNPSTL